MKKIFEEYKEIFEGILSGRRAPVNLLGGLGVAFSMMMVNPMEIQISNNLFFDLWSTHPVENTVSLILGYFWTNMLVKDINKITFRRFYFVAPIVVFWWLTLLAVDFISH